MSGSSSRLHERPVVVFATHGSDSIDARRIERLTERCAQAVKVLPFDYERKAASCVRLLRALTRERPALVVMEGTGIWGGLTVIVARALLGVPYVVSSGDAVGPFLGLHSRVIGVIGWVYEIMLCRLSAGFIGWTPYLVGRALTMGAPRGMTAAGWACGRPHPQSRSQLRARLGISETTTVFGLVGSLDWSAKRSYCYGQELVLGLKDVVRQDVAVVIVGDGTGRARLEHLAGHDLGTRVHLVGRVPQAEVADWLSAFDVASLPQSVDQVGSFRYSTKLPEYLSAGLPVVATAIPASYDLGAGWGWRLGGGSPWSMDYITAVSDLMREVTPEMIATRRQSASELARHWFDLEAQQRNVAGFVADILAARR